ncbi:ABC transporter substrate-binding protein [Halocella sp. SP3-1]|uniref:ABC transporter substrate-binding protein n=1 Tax=Halocella sp. SP3-1 TaxID=2382161 RepID=UPI000F7640DE|nr:ABC transporter substrate-binding protein [Halocella sp. SP3-1]AZO93321.1 hypothetical protein D7D81_01220 [Halocella sp. SP3-1]
MKRLLLIVLAGIMVLSLGLTVSAEDVVKIGLSAPITGNYAEYGENFRYSAQMAVEKINAEGGIRGRKVELVIMDSKGDPREAATIAQRFVENKEIVAEIGDFTSTACLASAPIYERNGMVQLSPTASHPDYAPAGHYMFGIVGTQDAEGPFNVEYIAQEYMGLDSVAVIYINNDWGVVTKDRFVESAKEKGLEVTTSQPFFEGERDYNAVLTKIRETNPDGIYIAAMYNEASLITRQIDNLGWDVEMLAPSSVFSDNFIDLAGGSAEGLATNTFFALNDPTPKVQAFIAEFKERADREPNLHAACAYDATLMLAEAIERAGFDRAAIRDELANTQDFVGVTGKLVFTEQGDIVRKYKIMVVEDNEWVIKEDYTK